ncbi:MAG: hypothetical protein M3O91_08865 [Chloroflexota bacterium]|nr:hypothetical protein [Chloroflexota bacterium]
MGVLRQEKAEILAPKQGYHVQNIERVTAYKREYVASQTAEHTELQRRRRVRKAGASGWHTEHERRDLCAGYFNLCA